VYAAGHAIDWRSFDRHGRDDPPARRKVPLPTYPWQRSSYWSPAATQAGPTPASPMWAAAAAAAALQADSGPLDLDVDSYPKRFELLERLAGAYIARAFRSMGLFTQAGEAHRVDELFDAGHIGETAMPFAEGYEHLAGRWLEHLVDDGLLTTDGDRFVSSTPLPDVDVESIVAEAEIAFEGIEPLLDYVMRCGDDLDAVVTGRETALNTLFPEGSYETVDFVYGGWAIPRYFNAIVRAAATAAANARPGRPLRVLEIGAGTGGTTAAVLPALPADRTSYTFTDVSDFFLARAAERFAAHPTVSYALLDIEDPPAAQGFEPASYDIVVAANVLHATKNLDVTLRHVRSLLAPGGVLLAYEGTHHPRWFDVTTGLIEGWQLFEDDWRDDVPLISPQRWSEALLASDFSDVAALPADDAPTSALLHNVLVARASGDEVVSVRPRLATHAAGMPDAEGSEVATVSFAAAPPDVAALLDAAMPDERHDVVVDVVRQAIALVLRIADHTTLRRDQPLLDLGFDSLMAVELRNVLRQWLALDQKIPATVVFDHPTSSHRTPA
jgi:SAM-dependent methyltransferase